MSLNWEAEERPQGEDASTEGAEVERLWADLGDGFEAHLAKVAATNSSGGDNYVFRWRIVDHDGGERAGDTSDSLWEAERDVLQVAQELFGGYRGRSASGPESE